MSRAVARILRAMLVVWVLAAVGAPAALAAFPGQNGKIAYVGSQEGDSEIYTIDPDGSGLLQLTRRHRGRRRSELVT